MDKYQSLRIWSYQHPNEALENEYLARFRGVTTLKTGLYLNPTKHGQRTLQTYELFLVLLPKILKIQDEIWLNWIRFINAQSLPELMKAFIAHYYFEYIHPFKDGNGRLGRYLTCVYLGHELDPLTAIAFSNEVDHERPKYYKAFVEVEEPKNHGEITFFVRDMMQILLQGQQKMLTELEEKWQLLNHGQAQITKDIDDPFMRKLVFLYLQAALFKVNNRALKDDEVKHYLKDEVWSKICSSLAILTKRGILVKIKNAPLTRCLADNYLDKLLG